MRAHPAPAVAVAGGVPPVTLTQPTPPEVAKAEDPTLPTVAAGAVLGLACGAMLMMGPAGMAASAALGVAVGGLMGATTSKPGTGL